MKKNAPKPSGSLSPPSETFESSVIDGGHIVSTCEFCGRTFFEDDPDLDWEDGEYEKLRQQAQQTPDLFIAVDSVHSGHIDGKEAVLGCPCNALRKYEDFIWGNRHVIAKYVAKRAKEAAEAAYQDEIEAEDLDSSIDNIRKFKKCCKCEGYFPEEIVETLQGKLYCPKCYQPSTCVGCSQSFDIDALDRGRCRKCASDKVIRDSEVVNRISEAFEDDRDQEDDIPF